ncbi:MAG: LemA family protein [Candidatus Colwellbacteria bacterium]|nr:LemA family protein [Candidatus Colwellbacteria bacterium]
MNYLAYVLVALGLLVVWLIYTYNKLVTLRYRAKEAISDIDVQLKRRFDLIPNLVETVKGYVKHEKGVLENVTKARASVASSNGNPLERAQSENILSNTLKSLFAVAENYPDLKANTNFLELQRELADTENKIQASRRFYNTTVMDLNTAVSTFPTKLMADAFGFKEESFFETENEDERKPVQVKF